MIGGTRTFKGGYRFSSFKGQPDPTLRDAAVPSKVTLLLEQRGQKIPIFVEPGETVKAGSIIARSSETVCSPVLSTVNGSVEAVAEVNWFGKPVNTVTIVSDGSSEWTPVDSPQRDWRHLSSDWLEKRLYRTGLTALGSSGIPTRFGSSVIEPGEAEHVIIHAVEDDVYNVSPLVLLQEKNFHSFFEGAAILKRIMPHAEFHVVLNRERTDLVSGLSRQTEGMKWLRVYGISPKYPQGKDEMLVNVILKREFPYGYSAANIGVVVLDLQSVNQMYEAVAEGKPLIERIIALSGPGFKSNSHLRVRIGTPLGTIVENRLVPDLKLRTICRSPLSGNAITDPSLPLHQAWDNIVSLVEKDSGEKLSFLQPGFRKDSFSRTFAASLLPFAKKDINTNMHGEPRACISCGYCEDVCPVRILPNLIHRFISRNMVDETVMNLGIHRCIDCNLCTYVCPSKIPVASLMKQGKEKLIEEGLNPAAFILKRVPLKGLPKNEEDTGENE